MVIAAVQVILLLVIGRVGYSVPFPQAAGALVVVLVVGVAGFCAMGVAMSTAIPNQESAGPITSIVFFVLLFLSGLWFPLKTDSGLAQFSNYFPVHHFILAVTAPFGYRPGVSPWAWRDLAVVAVWGVACAAIALRRFSWAPRRN